MVKRAYCWNLSLLHDPSKRIASIIATTTMKANVMKKVQKRPLSKNMTHYMHVNRYGRACYDFKLNFKLCLLIVTLSYTLKKKTWSYCYTRYPLCSVWSWTLTQIVCAIVFVVLWPGTLGWYGQTQIWLHRSGHLSSVLELRRPLTVDRASDSLYSEK